MDTQSTPLTTRRNPPRRAKTASASRPSATRTRRRHAAQETQEELRKIEVKDSKTVADNEYSSHTKTIAKETLKEEKGEEILAEENPNTLLEPKDGKVLGTIVEDAKESRMAAEQDSDKSNLKVFLRIRPLQKRSTSLIPPKVPSSRRKTQRLDVEIHQEKQHACLVAKDEHSVTLVPPPSSSRRRSKRETYNGFSHVFLPDSSQEDVFLHVMDPMLKEFTKGKGYLVVAMGSTSSGKTHTIFGNTKEPGLIPRALRKLLVGGKQDMACVHRNYFLSMFEIYSESGRGEKVFDLFQDGLELSFQQSTIKGLREVSITSVEDAEHILSQGMEKRTTASTNANNQSSRSQCIINIHYVSHTSDNEGCHTKSSDAVLTVVDLAGAEREKKTGNQGTRLNESHFINNTSMVFGQCLRALLEHQKNPKKPLQKYYHSSLLTRYLKDYMEGRGRMVMVLNVSPGEEHYFDTCINLRQASPYVDIKFRSFEEIPNTVGTKRSSNLLAKELLVKRKKLRSSSSHLGDRHILAVKKTMGERRSSGGLIQSGPQNTKTSLASSDKRENLSDQKGGENESYNCSSVLTLTKDELERRISLAVDSAYARWMETYSEVLGDVLKKHEVEVKLLEEDIKTERHQLLLEKEQSLKLSKDVEDLKEHCNYLQNKIEKLQITNSSIPTKEAATRSLNSSGPVLLEAPPPEYDNILQEKHDVTSSKNCPNLSGIDSNCSENAPLKEGDGKIYTAEKCSRQNLETFTSSEALDAQDALETSLGFHDDDSMNAGVTLCDHANKISEISHLNKVLETENAVCSEIVLSTQKIAEQVQKKGSENHTHTNWELENSQYSERVFECQNIGRECERKGSNSLSQTCTYESADCVECDTIVMAANVDDTSKKTLSTSIGVDKHKSQIKFVDSWNEGNKIIETSLVQGGGSGIGKLDKHKNQIKSVDSCNEGNRIIETSPVQAAGSGIGKETCEGTHITKQTLKSSEKSCKDTDKPDEPLGDCCSRGRGGCHSTQIDGYSKLQKGRMLAAFLVMEKKKTDSDKCDTNYEESQGEAESDNVTMEDAGPIGHCLEDLLRVPVAQIRNIVCNNDTKPEMNMWSRKDILTDFQFSNKYSTQECLCLRYCFWVLNKAAGSNKVSRLYSEDTKSKARQHIFWEILKATSVQEAASLAYQGLQLEGLDENFDATEASNQQFDPSISHLIEVESNKENIFPLSSKATRRKLPPASSFLLKSIDDTENLKSVHKSEKCVGPERSLSTKGRMSLARLLTESSEGR